MDLNIVMTYTGDVTPGGPPAVRELDRLTVTKLSVGPMDNNAYLLRCNATGEQVLIDAANEAPRLLELVGDGGLAAVVTTHQHMDHWVALEEVVAKTGARALVHADDAEGLPIEAERLADGDTVPVGDCGLEVIHLRGHTPGSIALLYRDPAGTPHLFTGGLPLPGWRGKHGPGSGALRPAHRRRRGQAVRPAAGRHLVLPGPRQGQHHRRRAARVAAVARPRLVRTPGPASPVTAGPGAVRQ